MRIIRALAGTRPRWRLRPDLPEILPDNPLLSGLNNMQLRTDVGLLDVLGDLPGVGTVEEAWQRSREADFRGVPCRVIELDALIAAKTFANRQKDHPTVKELEVIRDLLKKAKR